MSSIEFQRQADHGDSGQCERLKHHGILTAENAVSTRPQCVLIAPGLSRQIGGRYAQYHLGLCLAEGTDVPQNPVEALRRIDKAVEQGHEEARESVKEIR